MTPSEAFYPGSYTPAAGTFVCDCAEAHTWRIDVEGHLFPPFPAACTGRAWRSAVPSAHPEPAPATTRTREAPRP